MSHLETREDGDEIFNRMKEVDTAIMALYERAKPILERNGIDVSTDISRSLEIIESMFQEIESDRAEIEQIEGELLELTEEGEALKNEWVEDYPDHSGAGMDIQHF